MPQVFKIGSYLVYFWMDEGKPLEPIRMPKYSSVTEGSGLM